MVVLSICDPMVYFQLCVALVALQILIGLIASSLHKVFSEFLLPPLDTLCCCCVLSCSTSDKYLITNYELLSTFVSRKWKLPLNGSFQTDGKCTKFKDKIIMGSNYSLM